MLVNLRRYNLSGDVSFAQYVNGQTALRIVGEDGEQVAICTVNLEALGALDFGPNKIWVKTWSENEGINLDLARAGVATSTGIEFAVNVYGSVAVLMDLTPAAIAELEAQRKADLER